MRIVCLFALLALANAASPVDKVVELINELKAKIEADGKAEQKVYDKYACWCEKTTARKAGNIEEAKTSVEELTQLILELKGKKSTLTAEVKQLEKDIAANEAAQKEATSIRSKENSDYTTTRSQSEQTIGALEHAVKTLTGAGEGASALQQAQILSVAAGVRSALSKVPKDLMTPEDLDAAKNFVKDPTGFFSQKSASFSGAQISQNPFGDYAPASTVIQGTLKNMYDTFTSQLESANADEAGKQKSYEELMATKSQELATLKSTLENKQTTLGETSKNLADSQEEKAATQAQLDDDEAFFEDTKEACKSKADDWAERSRLRTEELAGINKAVEILTSDEAQATFGRATSMFLQTAQDSESAPRAKAYRALKGVARKYHSLRLAALAATVKTGGHFDSVIKSVEKMIGDLRSEEQDDIDHRDWCQEHENKFTNQKEDLEYKVGQTEALIERLTAKSGELETAIKNTEDEILQTQEAMAEALANRNEENSDFKAALKDDTDAVALLASALEALTAYSANNKLGLIQKKKQPEYAVDPDAAPSADFSSGDSNKSETGGITGIIGMIKEDLENEIKEAKAAEATALAEFNKQRAAALATVAALKEKKTNQEMQKADTDEKNEDAEGVKTTTETSVIQKQMELDSIEPNCSWIKGAFDDRRTKRKAEIEGLINAKAYLAGQSAGSSLVQKEQSFLRKRMA